MEPINSNGAQMFVDVASIVRKRFLYMNMISLGSVQMGIGVVCILLHIVLLAAPDAHSELNYIGHGIWTGSFFILTGFFGIIGGKQKTRCPVVAFNVLSIAAGACFAPALIGIAMASALLLVRHYFLCLVIGGVVVESLLALLGFAEAIVAIMSSIICCMMGACCRDCNGCCCCPPSTNSDQLITIDPATYGRSSTIIAFPPGQGSINSNNQVQQMAFSNQQPMFQPNAPPPGAAYHMQAEHSRPPPECGNPNFNYIKLQSDDP